MAMLLANSYKLLIRVYVFLQGQDGAKGDSGIAVSELLHWFTSPDKFKMM